MAFDMIPRAKKVREAEGSFTFDCLKIFFIGGGEAFTRTLRALRPDIVTEQADREEANVIFSVSSVYSSQNEYCAIRILPDRMEIRCRDEAGARNAACILAQIAEGNTLSCGELIDWPDAACRSMMLESSGRCWLSMERIYLYLRQMALARMNDMQFHFMENPGCTIQLDTLPDMHGFGPDNLKFTKQEIRDMIAYAGELGITVTPFVEVLSHSVAFNNAAGVACPGDREPYMFAVCVGQDKTYEIIEKVLGEIAELFPAPVLHIGGDEYDMSAVSPRTVRWQKCPHCRALSERMGYTTNRELFIYALERVNRIVNKLGKIAMVWNADLKPGEIPDLLERNLVIHYYRSDNPLCGEKIFNLSMDGYAEDGFSVLNSSYRQTYLDRYVTSERWSSWGYLTDPKVSLLNQAQVIGGCCCAWEEHAHFEYTISPAIFLFADRLWHSNGDPTVYYDGKFGPLLTKLLFDGLLPEGMNVFEAVGNILPPVDETRAPYIYPFNIAASIRELEAILSALQSIEHPLAESYIKIANAALDYRRKREAETVAESVDFEG